MCEIHLRSDAGNYLSLTLLGRSHPGLTDYWDGNWLKAEVDFRIGSFQGSVSGDLRSEELVSFLDQLTQLQESLRGEARFETMEEWLTILISGNGRGHMKCHCVILDEPGIGNTLDGTFVTDQTFTRATVLELFNSVRTFPVFGNP